MKKALLNLASCVVLAKALENNVKYQELNKDQQTVVGFIGGATIAIVVHLLVD